MEPTRKIPTLLAILLIIGIMIGVGIFFEAATRQSAKASIALEPKQYTLTNLSDTSFSVLWHTDDATTGMLMIQGPNGKKYTAYDERDASGTMGSYITHHVTVRNLIAQTPYMVTIVSGGKKYPTNSPYQVSTVSTIAEEPSNMDPAYGTLLTAEGKPAEGAIVILSLENGQTLSTIVRASGSWVVPLASVRTQDGYSYLPKLERISETILFQLGVSESRITTDTLNDSPLPEVFLGQPYDFRGRDAKKPTTQTVAQAPVQSAVKPQVLGEQTTKVPSPTGDITLASPAQNAAIVSVKPLISGTAIKNSSVTITLTPSEMKEGEKPEIATMKSGADGTWRYTPKTSLTPRKYMVTMTTMNAKKIPVAITHVFTVMKSGTQVLGDATESATLSPTPSLIATLSATPTISATDSTELVSEELPTSGSVLPTILFLFGAILFITTGAAVAFIK